MRLAFDDHQLDSSAPVQPIREYSRSEAGVFSGFWIPPQRPPSLYMKPDADIVCIFFFCWTLFETFSIDRDGVSPRRH